MRYRTVTRVENSQGETLELYTKYDNFPNMTFFWDMAMEMGNKLKPGYRGFILMYDGDHCIQNIKIGPTK